MPMLPNLCMCGKNKYVINIFVKPRTHTHRRERGGKKRGVGREGEASKVPRILIGRRAPSSDCGFWHSDNPKCQSGPPSAELAVHPAN